MSRQVPPIRRDERGLGVLEVLVATALAVVAGFMGLAACKTIAHVLSSTAADHTGVDAEAARLQDDAATALAVFVPATDSFGRLNSGQELDFYSKADDGRAILWCYAYDAATETLRRWDIDADGVHGVRDVLTGSVDPAARYPALEHVARFIATPVAADQLGDAGVNVYSGVAQLFPRAPKAESVRYALAGGAESAPLGGNGVTQVSMANGGVARIVHLAAGSMPSGFTVRGAAVWHAVVYRVDQSHRFLLGTAGKSHVFINARVDVSYDRWKTRKQWCDFNLLGNPNGLDGHDPHADYKPNEPVEQTDAIIAACLQRYPQPPGLNSDGNPSDAGAVHPPLPGQTPPPCWSRPGPQGRCWPANVGPDWTPPSPFPAESPPPQWCAEHRRSPLCGGDSGPPTGSVR